MALPQRKETSEPEPDLRNLEEPRRVEKATGSGWRFGFWWVWAIIIVLIWYVGYGWGGSGGWLRHRTAQPAAQNDAAQVGDGAVMLQSANKRQYIGQAFNVQNAAVLGAVSPTAYWIGSATNGSPMLLVLQGAAAYRSGTRIDAAGKVVAAPPAAQAQQQWKLSPTDVKRLEQQGAYVQATEAQAVSSGTTSGSSAP